MILQDYGKVRPTHRAHPVLSACLGALLTGMYGLWNLFAVPGFRKVPWNLKVLEISSFCCYPPALPFKSQMLLTCAKSQDMKTEHNLHSNDNFLILEHSAPRYQEENGKSITVIMFYRELHHLLQYVNLKCIFYTVVT